MNASAICPKCGKKVPSDAPLGHCPGCVLGLLGEGLFREPGQEIELLSDTGNYLKSPVFGDYELLEEIARGGMGVIYKARQKSLNRFVAIKMILAGQFATKQFVQRFRAEAGAAAALQHPNIVAIHDIGLVHDQHYFSMDYVEGQNLAELVGNHPLPPKKAAHYVKLIAEAIHYAHTQSILHRDLKPSNILIDSASDQPRITDFGLAKRMDGGSSLTLTGQVLGSPHFMPPEQASSERGKVGRHSDVYALGGILFYLLTGRAPFQGETLESTLHLVLNTEPVSPRLLNSMVPRDLETICLKCLEKDPAKRYPTAQAMAEELESFLNDESILARPVSPLQKTWRWCQRKPLVAALSMLVILLLFAVAIGSPIAAFRINHARQQALASADELRRNLYVADLKNASQSIQNHQIGQAKELLGQYASDDAAGLRTIEWSFLWQQCQPNYDISYSADNAEITCAVLSSSGGLLAAGGKDGTIRVWDLETRNLVKTLSGFDSFIDLKSLAFSPDGTVLAGKGGRNLRAWKVGLWTELGPAIPVEPNWNVNNAVAFSKDGKLLATRVPGGVGLMDGQNWQTNFFLLEDRNRYRDTASLGTVLAFSPDGRFLMLSDWHELIVRQSQAPYTPLKVLRREPLNEDMRIVAIAFSEKYFAVGYRDGVVALFDSADCHQITSFQAQQQGFLYDVALSPDGKLLAACGEEDVIKVWQVEDLLRIEQGLVAPPSSLLRGHSRKVNSLAFTGTLTLLSSGADGTIKLWKVRNTRSEASLNGSVLPLWFSGNGQQMLGSDTNSQIHLWDVVKGMDLGQVGPPLDSTQEKATTISPDGELVVVIPISGGLMQLRDLRTGQTFRKFELQGETFLGAIFALKRAERRLAFATSNDDGITYWIWDLGGQKQPIPVASGARLSLRPAFALSQDGDLLAFAKTENNIQLSDLPRATFRLLPAPGGRWDSLTISGDGTSLAAGGWGNYMVRIWEIKSGRELTPLTLPDEGSPAIEFSPDGKSLVTCSFEGVVRFWNVALRKETVAVPNYNPMKFFLLFSPDGSTLALPSPKQSAGLVSVWRTASPGLFKNLNSQSR
jgi:eukaryotic-like serine/threonine-protein kinase